MKRRKYRAFAGFEQLESRRLLTFVTERISDLDSVGTFESGSEPMTLANLGDSVYSLVGTLSQDDSFGVELWKTDGAKTVLVKHISDASAPSRLTEVGGTLFFFAEVSHAETDESHIELWKSNGTLAGTVLVKILPGNGTFQTDSQPFVFQGQLFFEYFRVLWRSNGTSAGTQPLLSSTGLELIAFDGSYSPFSSVNGSLYVAASSLKAGTNVFDENGLWYSDGTNSGFTLIPELNSGKPIDVNGVVYVADNSLLWQISGGTASLVQIFPHKVLSQLTNLDGTLLFFANGGKLGSDLWSLSADEGMQNLGNFSGDYNLLGEDSLIIDGVLYFTADDGQHGNELWKTDGFFEGTELVRDLNPGADSSHLANFTDYDGTLIFTAGPTGTVLKDKLYSSDGTATGTKLVETINGPALSHVHSNIIKDHGALYFGNGDVWRMTEPKVVNIITHGLGNDLPIGNSTLPLVDGFLNTWYALRDKLNYIPTTDSKLEGKVVTYVANWDSSTGWVPGALSKLVGIFMAAVSQEKFAAVANATASKQLELAKMKAKEAASKINKDVIKILGDAQLSQSGDQIIHLIGHSRGAAVNARLAEHLVNEKYHIDQFTSLDGYGEDWPGISKDLADTDIVGILAGISGIDLSFRDNYRVEKGLAEDFVTSFAPYLNAAATYLSGGNPVTGMFATSVVQQIVARMFDWRAPDRAGFGNQTLTGYEPPPDVVPAGFNTNVASVHTNITQLYLNSGSESIPVHNRYLWDNYLGRHRDDPATASAAALRSDEELYGDARTLANALGEELGEAGGEESRGQFLGGEFDSLAVLVADAMALTVPPELDDPGIQTWLGIAQNPVLALATYWNVVGDAELAERSGNAVMELRQTALGTSISQTPLIDAGAASIVLDVETIAAGAGDVLEVLFGDRVIGSLDLRGPRATGLWQVGLPIDLVPSAGDLPSTDAVTFRLAGPAVTPAIVHLDNIYVNYNPEFTGVTTDLVYREFGALVPLVPQQVIEDDMPNGANFDMGSIRVLLETGTFGAGEQIVVRNEGNGAGQVGKVGSNVTYGGILIGTWQGGTGTAPLEVSLNENSSLEAVQALLHNLAYRTPNSIPVDSLRTVSIRISDGDGGESKSISVSIVNVPEADVFEGTSPVADGGTVAFGLSPFGSPAVIKTLTVKNTGVAPLTMSSATLTGAGFTIVTNVPTTLAAGASTSLVVRLDTTVAGIKSAVLSFANNDSNENPYNFTLTGTVTVPEVDVLNGVTAVPDGTGVVAFGNAPLGSAALTKTLTVKNTGAAPLTMSAATLSGAGFTILTNVPASLAAGASANLVIRFDTAVVGPKSAVLSFANNDSNENPYNFTLTGTVTVDSVGFTLVESGGNTIVNETGSSDSFTIVLTKQPTSNVVIKVTSGDTGEATVNKSALTFTAQNFNLAQTITVTGVDDANLDHDQQTLITISIDDANSDDAFDQLADQSVLVTTIDDESTALDFGDAPTVYPVTLANNGARHTAGVLILGGQIDAEADGQPTTAANGDGADDDGVFVIASIISSATGTSTSSFSVIASGTGKIDGFIDFNKDGDWNDDGEKIFKSVPVVAGANLLSYTVPSGATAGSTGAQFRLSTAGGLSSTGAAADGEVEDYLVTIVTASPSAVLDIDVPAGDVNVVVEGSNLVVRKGSTVLFQAPFASFGTLNLSGSSIDDILSLAILQALGTDVLKFDGGAGHDILKLVEAGRTLDLTNPKVSVRDIEGIDITGTGDNKLILNVDQVKAASTTTDTLEVVANTGDSVAFGTGWKVETPRFINGVFTHIISETTVGGTGRIELHNDKLLTNPLTPFDVDRDGSIKPLDALKIINEIRRRGSGAFSLPTNDNEINRLYFDVNGDSRLTPLDALRIINAIARLARNGNTGSGEGEATAAVAAAQPVDLNLFKPQQATQRHATDVAINEIVLLKVSPPIDHQAPAPASVAAIDDVMAGYGSDDKREDTDGLQLLSTN